MLLFSIPRPRPSQTLLASIGAGALLLASALQPASISAAPSADLKPVARQDTVVYAIGSGTTEITDPQNMNPYSLGGLGRARARRGLRG